MHRKKWHEVNEIQLDEAIDDEDFGGEDTSAFPEPDIPIEIRKILEAPTYIAALNAFTQNYFTNVIQESVPHGLNAFEAWWLGLDSDPYHTCNSFVVPSPKKVPTFEEIKSLNAGDLYGLLAAIFYYRGIKNTNITPQIITRIIRTLAWEQDDMYDMMMDLVDNTPIGSLDFNYMYEENDWTELEKAVQYWYDHQ